MKRSPGLLGAVVLSAFTSQVGDAAFAVGVVVYAVQSTGGATAAGAAIAFASLVGLLVTPIGGAYLDRRNRLLVMIRSDVARAGLLVVAAVVIQSDPRRWLFVVPLLVLLQVLTGFFTPGLLATGVAVAPDLEAAVVVSRLDAAVRAGRFLGPLAGGVLGGRGFLYVCVFNALTFSVSAVLLYVVETARAAAPYSMPVPRDSFRSALVRGVVVIRTRPVLRNAVALATCLNFCISLYVIGLPILALVDLGASSDGAGVLQGAFQGAMLVTAVLLGPLRLAARVKNDSITISLCTGVLVAGFALTAGAADAFWLVPGIAVTGLGLVATSTFADTRLVTAAPEEHRASVFGTTQALSGALRPLGTVTCAWAADRVGVRAVILTAAVVGGVLALLVGLSRGLDDEAATAAGIAG